MNYTTDVAELVRFLLRIPVDIHTQLLAWAEEENRSLNGQIVHLLTQAVKKRKK